MPRDRGERKVAISNRALGQLEEWSRGVGLHEAAETA
jgi:hypothetical protein